MKLELRIQNLDKVREALNKLSSAQARQAYANAINDTGFMVRKAMQSELEKFDGVTPFIRNSPKLIAATADNLSATILPTLDGRNLPGKGGKVGVDPQQVLQAQEFGGRRHDKRSEVLLRDAGILLAGWQTAIPINPYPGSHDGRGNMRGAFMQQLLSYLQTYKEQGYRANMGKKRIDSLQNKQGIGNIATRKVFKTTLGVRYFVSYGRLRGQHLPPGIWASRGTHGVDIRPVLMFVRTPTYTPRISMDRIASDSGAQDYLDRRIRFRIRNLVEGKPA